MTRRSFVGAVGAAAGAWIAACRPARGATPPVRGAPRPAVGREPAGLAEWRVVDYQGWIVRPDDRERLRAGRRRAPCPTGR